MTDREERLMRALTRIAEAAAMVGDAGFDLPPDCDTTILILEGYAQGLRRAAARVRRELDRAGAPGRGCLPGRVCTNGRDCSPGRDGTINERSR